MSLAKRIKELESRLPKIVVVSADNVTRVGMGTNAFLRTSVKVDNAIKLNLDDEPVLTLEQVDLLRNKNMTQFPIDSATSNFNTSSNWWDFTVTCISNQLRAGDTIYFNFSAPNTTNEKSYLKVL